MTEPKPMQPSKMSSLLKGEKPVAVTPTPTETPTELVAKGVPGVSQPESTQSSQEKTETTPAQSTEVVIPDINDKKAWINIEIWAASGSLKAKAQLDKRRALLAEQKVNNLSKDEVAPPEDPNERANEKYRRGDLGY
jgi:hypothetical protein